MASRDGAKSNGPFDIIISVDNTPDKNIECKVTITNNDDEDLHISIENTPFEWIGHPLEGETSDNFIIHEENFKLVEYDGIMVKRENEPDPMLVTKKSSKTTTVRLADSYSFDLKKSASYTVQLKTTLYYHSTGTTEIYSQVVQSNQQLFSLEETSIVQCKGPSGLTIIVKCHADSSYGVAETNEAFAAARDIIRRSIDSTSNDSRLYTRWFGTDFTDSVHKKYKKMDQTMEDGITINLRPYIGDLYGFFKLRYPEEISLCGLYYKAPMKGKNSKMGIIVHEMSHAAAGTDDIVIDRKKQYGHKKCLRLAKDNQIKARMNADNFEYYSEELDSQ